MLCWKGAEGIWTSMCTTGRKWLSRLHCAHIQSPFPTKTFVIKVNFPLVNTGLVPFLVRCPEFGTIKHGLATLNRNIGVECPTLTYAPDGTQHHWTEWSCTWKPCWALPEGKGTWENSCVISLASKGVFDVGQEFTLWLPANCPGGIFRQQLPLKIFSQILWLWHVHLSFYGHALIKNSVLILKCATMNGMDIC